MRILYPLNPLEPKAADEPYQQEFSLLKAKGIDCSLFDFDALDFDQFRPKPKPKLNQGETVLYRGWMLNPTRYSKLVENIKGCGATPITSTQDYLKYHHLPNWYDSCREFTAKSRFFPDDAKLQDNVSALNWAGYFVKDYVKSNSSERGSIADTSQQVSAIVELIKQYRGEIEDGVAIRRVEHYDEASQIRYFVFNGKAYSPDGKVPKIVQDITTKVNVPFTVLILFKGMMVPTGLLKLVTVKCQIKRLGPPSALLIC
jgi:hypothetical protein